MLKSWYKWDCLLVTFPCIKSLSKIIVTPASIDIYFPGNFTFRPMEKQFLIFSRASLQSISFSLFILIFFVNANLYTFSKILADGTVFPNSFLETVTCSTPICSANSLWERPNIARIDLKSSGKLYFIFRSPQTYLYKFNINLFI